MQGYQQILDDSQISKKLLNDQLEQLWLRTQALEEKWGQATGPGSNPDPAQDPMDSIELQKILAQEGYLGGRKYKSTEDKIFYYLSSTTGDDSNDGSTQETPKRTIKNVLLSLPHHFETAEIVFVSGDFYEVLDFPWDFQGRLSFTALGTCHLYVEMKFSMLHADIKFNGIEFYAINRTSITVEGPAIMLYIGSSRLNFGCTDRAGGVVASKGSCVILDNTNICNALSAVSAATGARIGMFSCSGGNNTYNTMASSGGSVSLSGTVPASTNGNFATQAGTVVTANTTEKALIRPVGTTCSAKKIQATGILCAAGEGWTQGEPTQGVLDGTEYSGYWVFNAEKRTELNTLIAGNVIRNAEMCFHRGGGIGSKDPVPIYLYEHNINETSSTPTVGNYIGAFEPIRQGQYWSIRIPDSTIQALANGTIQGIAMKTPAGKENDVLQCVTGETPCGYIQVIVSET